MRHEPGQLGRGCCRAARARWPKLICRPRSRAPSRSGLGRWYIDKLQRPTWPCPAFKPWRRQSRAMTPALDGMTQIYRKAQQWQELGMVLTAPRRRRQNARASSRSARRSRRDSRAVPETTRRARAASTSKSWRTIRAIPRPATPSAASNERTQDFTNLVKHLSRRSEAQRGDDKLRSLSRIAELYETQLSDDTEAVRRYKDVLAVDAHHPEALRGLDRVYSKLGRFQDLLENLRLQIEAARHTSPKSDVVGARGRAARRRVHRSARSGRRLRKRGQARPEQRERADRPGAPVPRPRTLGRTWPTTTSATSS